MHPDWRTDLAGQWGAVVDGVINSVSGEDKGAIVFRTYDHAHCAGSVSGQKNQFQIVSELDVALDDPVSDAVQAAILMAEIHLGIELEGRVILISKEKSVFGFLLLDENGLASLGAPKHPKISGVIKVHMGEDQQVNIIHG